MNNQLKNATKITSFTGWNTKIAKTNYRQTEVKAIPKIVVDLVDYLTVQLRVWTCKEQGMMWHRRHKRNTSQ